MVFFANSLYFMGFNTLNAGSMLVSVRVAQTNFIYIMRQTS